MKKCPYCAEEIPDEAIYCRHCNHNLNPKGTIKNKWVTFAGGILLIVLIASFGMFTYYRNNLFVNAQQSNEFILATKDANLAQQNSIIATLTRDNYSLTSIIATQAFHILDLDTRNKELDESLQYEKSVYATLSVQNNQLNKRYQEKVQQLNVSSSSECLDVTFKPDYTSNSSMAYALKKFVEENHGSVLDSSFEVFWNDSKTSIHSFITSSGDKRIKYLFLVFFQQNLRPKGVFWVNEGCWIAR